jgi:hypothetical protein
MSQINTSQPWVCPPPDRRSHTRYSVSKITSYSYGGKWYLTLTLDLGLGGMKIKAHDSLPVDECLDFKLVLEDKFIWLRGRIAYIGLPSWEERVSGVQFMDLSEPDRSSLEDDLATLQDWPKPQGMLSMRRGTGPDRRQAARE